MKRRFRLSLWALVLIASGAACARAPQVSFNFQIRAPKAKRALPALMVFGGFESAGQVLDLLPRREDIVMASFDYPFQGSRKFQFPRTIKEGPMLKQSLIDTVSGIRKLREKLAADSTVDPKRIAVIGASFGSPFALAAAQADPNLQTVFIIHGFTDTTAVLKHRLGQILGPSLGLLTPFASWTLSHAITAYLDPPASRQVKLQPHQRVVVFAAKGDQFIPAEATQQMKASLQSSGAQVEWNEMSGGHIGPGSEKMIAGLVSKISTYLGIQ